MGKRNKFSEAEKRELDKLIEKYGRHSMLIYKEFKGDKNYKQIKYYVTEYRKKLQEKLHIKEEECSNPQPVKISKKELELNPQLKGFSELLTASVASFMKSVDNQNSERMLEQFSAGFLQNAKLLGVEEQLAKRLIDQAIKGSQGKKKKTIDISKTDAKLKEAIRLEEEISKYKKEIAMVDEELHQQQTEQSTTQSTQTKVEKPKKTAKKKQNGKKAEKNKTKPVADQVSKQQDVDMESLFAQLNDQINNNDQDNDFSPHFNVNQFSIQAGNFYALKVPPILGQYQQPIQSEDISELSDTVLYEKVRSIVDAEKLHEKQPETPSRTQPRRSCALIKKPLKQPLSAGQLAYYNRGGNYREGYAKRRGRS